MAVQTDEYCFFIVAGTVFLNIPVFIAEVEFQFSGNTGACVAYKINLNLDEKSGTIFILHPLLFWHVRSLRFEYRWFVVSILNLQELQYHNAKALQQFHLFHLKFSKRTNIKGSDKTISRCEKQHTYKYLLIHLK